MQRDKFIVDELFYILPSAYIFFSFIKQLRGVTKILFTHINIWNQFNHICINKYSKLITIVALTHDLKS